MPAHTLRPKVAVLGAGSWGTALAALACARADVLLWARDTEVAGHIDHLHRHPRHLDGIALPSSLRATADFSAALAHAGAAPDGLIILGVPVAALDETCARLAAELDGYRAPGRTQHVLWTCKGFHPQDGRLPHDIAAQRLSGVADLGLGVLSGPSFATEVARGLPVALTLATTTSQTLATGQAALHGDLARVYGSDDVIGVEVGGALKNIIAIACGISDGLGMGDNSRAALITRGLAEMQRLGMALGAQASTFAGLTGLGDLVLSATGDQSRNRQVGLAIGRGQLPATLLSGGPTAEGVRCVRAVRHLGRARGVELPITDAVCAVLFEGLPPEQAATRLLAREARPESTVPAIGPATPLP